MTESPHPVLRIMAERAAAQDIDVETINASVQHRALMTLVIEVLDMSVGSVVAHPELIPTAVLTLRGYADLLDRSQGVIANSPEFQEMIKHHQH
jgi:hypothetical protein